MQCDVSADTHFGPRVSPCRRDFDFTLLFEQWILALVPDLSFLILCLCRWYFIRGGRKEIHRGVVSTYKTVGLHFPFF